MANTTQNTQILSLHQIEGFKWQTWRVRRQVDGLYWYLQTQHNTKARILSFTLPELPSNKTWEKRDWEKCDPQSVCNLSLLLPQLDCGRKKNSNRTLRFPASENSSYWQSISLSVSHWMFSHCRMFTCSVSPPWMFLFRSFQAVCE